MAAPTDSAASQLRLLGDLIKQQRLALGYSSKEKAADACGLSHMTYRNAENGTSVSKTTYAKIEKTFGFLSGSCRAVLDGADSIHLTDGSELIHDGRISRPDLSTVDAEVQTAIREAASLTTPELTLAQATALAEAAIDRLRAAGLLPGQPKK
ncbi:helix-turn-helix domain-containing protein [Streptomyces sp. NRRL F-5135]|uniref:helix-turn-helix domain-containing protein n=1 Tax=Streptomyces sp. NRRL F-5135 TaxID=1463858 RepID=UPI00131DF368|nr:helix-turn-helix transcriptional regulator [Streptomyces sp. NRRL F-5135]